MTEKNFPTPEYPLLGLKVEGESEGVIFDTVNDKKYISIKAKSRTSQAIVERIFSDPFIRALTMQDPEIDTDSGVEFDYTNILGQDLATKVFARSNGNSESLTDKEAKSIIEKAVDKVLKKST